MTWIDDDKAEQERQRHSAAELQRREAEIAEVSEKIYNNLWKEITDNISEAKSKGLPPLLTNGSSYERMVIVSTPVQPSETFSHPDEFVLRLMNNKQVIRFAGPKTDIVLQLDLCDDGVVRIKHEGEHKEIREVAKLLLRPFLFPDLFGAIPRK